MYSYSFYKDAQKSGTFRSALVSISGEKSAQRNGLLGQSRLALGHVEIGRACFAVRPECVITIAPQGARDGTRETTFDAGRKNSRSPGCAAEGRPVRVLSALFGAAFGAKLQNDLRGLRLLHVVFGLLLATASRQKPGAASRDRVSGILESSIVRRRKTWHCE